MNGKTEEEIMATRNEAIKNITLSFIAKEGFDVIDSYFREYDPEKGCIPLKYLGRSIKKLANADLAYFVKGWDQARGCVIEHQCAEMYGIPFIEE